MNLAFAEILQEVVDHARLRHEIRLAQQGSPRRALAFPDVGKQIFRIENAADRIFRSVVDGDSRISRLKDYFQRLVPGIVKLDRRDVDTRNHDLPRLLLAEAQDSLQHLLVFLLLHIGDFQSLLKLIGRDRLLLLGDDPVDDRGRLHHQLRQR